MTYFDFAANPPVNQDVLDTFYHITKKYYANPNSFHKLGREVNQLIEQSTNHIKEILKTDKEVIYTSGATEANNLAVKGLLERYRNKGRHVLISPFEHNSITASLTSIKNIEIEILPLDHNGQIDLNSLSSKLREDTILVSVTTADSELAILQPIKEIAKLLKNTNTYFHTDASQSIGKVFIDYSDTDLVTLTPHKFYGMNGTGALLKKKDIGLHSLIDGGRSTTIFRSGTPVAANIIAFDKALTIALEKQEERYHKVLAYHDELYDFLSHYTHVHINSTKTSLPHIINFSLPSIKADILAQLFESKNIYLSAKTSCCPAHTPSKPVYALTHNRQYASSSVRLSLSHLNTKEDIEIFKNAFDQIYKENFDD